MSSHRAIYIGGLGALTVTLVTHPHCDPLETITRCAYREHVHPVEPMPEAPPLGNKVVLASTAVGSLSASTSFSESARALETFTTARG